VRIAVKWGARRKRGESYQHRSPAAEAGGAMDTVVLRAEVSIDAGKIGEIVE
jgi:hypothetical protein